MHTKKKSTVPACVVPTPLFAATGHHVAGSLSPKHKFPVDLALRTHSVALMHHESHDRDLSACRSVSEVCSDVEERGDLITQGS